MTDGVWTAEEYHSAVVALGRSVESRTCLEELLRTQEQLEKNRAEARLFSATAHIGEAFLLNREERLALALCAARLEERRPLPRWGELAELLNRLGAPAGEISPVFCPEGESGCLHPMVQDFLMERQPHLPQGMKLELCVGEERLYHSTELLEELDAFLEAAMAQEGSVGILLRGEEGSGKRFLLTQLAKRRGCTLLLLDTTLGPEEIQDIVVAARLYQAMVCLWGCTQKSQGLIGALEDYLRVICMTQCEDGPEPTLEGLLLCRRVQPMSPEERYTAMEQLFRPRTGEETRRLKGSAELGRPTMGQMRTAAGRYRAECLSRPQAARELVLGEILRGMSKTALGSGAQLLSTSKTMEELVLPEPQKRQIRDLCAFARAREIVYRQWGFEKKISYGRGLSALFYGASGTGKTMAASVLANELGLELYRVDLSQLISKYIGETQKNIGKIFDEAQKCDCILFFDEADALFARRSDAGDAQDKYSNAEIAYLLQRTEEYDGIILLATNLLQNFDEAFRRRIGFMIHFPLPDAALRRLLWQGIFPAQAPVEGLDWELLAEQLELSGAGIRNCAVNAAYLAAAAGQNITMDWITEAARIEYRKQGKSVPAKLDLMFPAERRI